MKQFFLSLVIFTLLLFGLHFLLLETVLSDLNFFYSIYSIYSFNFLTSVFVFGFLFFVHKSFAEKTGFAFMAISLIKMFAAVVFLIPLIKSESLNPVTDVSAFFIPYFLYLTFETIFAVRLINKA